jgi:acetolactate synthase I/II/III large subunit
MKIMKVVDAIVEILRKEGVELISCFPTNAITESGAAQGIRPIICRQERVGVGIADGYTRVTNGKKIGVFAMQFGPGAENAFAGVSTAFSDSVPVLLLPSGHKRDRAQVWHHFSSVRTFASVTKYGEVLNLPDRVSEVMQRAFGQLRAGRFGPVVVEIPTDVLQTELSGPLDYKPVIVPTSQGDPEDVAKAAKALLRAERPIIIAGQGVLYAEASGELVQLAELLHIPVMTTLLGKSAFPETHPLSLGSGSVTTSGPVVPFLEKADLVLAVGSSLTRHGMSVMIPPGKVIVHIANDTRDINKDYRADYPILGDARLVLQQLLKAVKGSTEDKGSSDDAVENEVKKSRDEWLNKWMPRLTSSEVPINPYRVYWDFIKTTNPDEAIVTHDSGSQRDILVPFYRTTVPRGYLGWGKSHQLGTGLGLVIGAKIAKPEKFCVNFMGDGAFGMTGLDFETSGRMNAPITTVVVNNSIMGTEKETMATSHQRFKSRNLTGNYAEIGRALGGYGERVEKPEDIVGAFERAKLENAKGRPALLEFITREEYAMYS